MAQMSLIHEKKAKKFRDTCTFVRTTIKPENRQGSQCNNISH